MGKSSGSQSQFGSSFPADGYSIKSFISQTLSDCWHELANMEKQLGMNKHEEQTCGQNGTHFLSSKVSQ